MQTKSFAWVQKNQAKVNFFLPFFWPLFSHCFDKVYASFSSSYPVQLSPSHCCPLTPLCTPASSFLPNLTTQQVFNSLSPQKTDSAKKKKLLSCSTSCSEVRQVSQWEDGEGWDGTSQAAHTEQAGTGKASAGHGAGPFHQWAIGMADLCPLTQDALSAITASRAAAIT